MGVHEGGGGRKQRHVHEALPLHLRLQRWRYGTLLKKKRKFDLISYEIQKGSGAKSYMTNGSLIYDQIFAHFLIYLGSPSSEFPSV